MPSDAHRPSRGFLAIIGPGLLVAATGVGAGDLATAALAGGHFASVSVGTAVLWAVLAGAFLKFVVNEGLARWQIATGRTLLEGAVEKLGRVVGVLFLPYLLFWSCMVATALMGACGVTMHAIVESIAPVFDDASTGKVVYGIAHGIIGVALVLAGGFALFEKVMRVCIGIMFVTVVVTAGCLWPGTDAVLRGLFVPDPATLAGEELRWTVALMGGVGGTVTVLCYGYWMRESGRSGREDLTVCRLDLAVAYAMTAVFGVCMVIIGSQVGATGKGATLVVDVAARLEEPLGPVGRWAFLVGAWGAVASSLLGVWQAVPYLFADLLGLLFARRAARSPSDAADDALAGAPESLPDDAAARSVDTRGWSYRLFLVGLATLPIPVLLYPFATVQKLYAVVGAFFVPMLALVLLVLNGRADWVGERFRSRPWTTSALVATLLFFGWILVGELTALFDTPAGR